MTNLIPDSLKIDRRKFFAKLGIYLSGFIGALIAIPVVGALLAPLLKKTVAQWRSVGSVDDFEIKKTVLVEFRDASPLPWAGPTAQTAAWLRRKSEKEFVAFSINCTHLGCPVRWIEDADLFLCPCHGGVYNQDGSNAAGPPPKGLVKYPVRIHDDEVEIQTSPLPITRI